MGEKALELRVHLLMAPDTQNNGVLMLAAGWLHRELSALKPRVMQENRKRSAVNLRKNPLSNAYDVFQNRFPGSVRLASYSSFLQKMPRMPDFSLSIVFLCF